MSEEAILDILVSPKSSRSEIVMQDDEIVKVYLKSPPVDDKANIECIRLFSNRLRIAKTRIQIIKGKKTKKKRIIIQGLSDKEVIRSIKGKDR